MNTARQPERQPERAGGRPDGPTKGGCPGTDDRTTGVAPGLPHGLPPVAIPRATVRTVACPRCGAPAGTPCQGRRGDRKANHLQRVELAAELRLGVSLQLPRRSQADADGAGSVTRRAGRRPEREALDAAEHGGSLDGTPGSDRPLAA